MKEQLTRDEQDILYSVRKFGETEVLPIINPYWERGDFPFELIPKIAKLNSRSLEAGDRRCSLDDIPKRTTRPKGHWNCFAKRWWYRRPKRGSRPKPMLQATRTPP
jgi:hypothetical protein